VGVALLHLTLAGTILHADTAFVRLVRVGVDDLVGTSVTRLVAPQDRPIAVAELVSREPGLDSGTFTCRVLAALPTARWTRFSWHIEHPQDGEAFCVVEAQDVDDEAREALLAHELLSAVDGERATLHAALEASPDGMAIFVAERDERGRVVDARLVRMNRAGARGHRVEDMTGRPLREYFPEAAETGLHDALLQTLTDGRTRRLLVEVGERGSWPGVFENVVAAIDDDRVLCSFRDVTQAHADEQRLLHAATHDALTGLPNRVLLRDRIEHALQRVHRDGGAVAIAFLDLDGFKAVNDTRGHRHGDEVLRQAALRLTRSVREEDTVARLGGDEFVLVLEGCQDEEQWRQVYQRVVASLGEPLEVGGHEVTLRASVGVVFAPADETDADAVMRNADIAMYAAKNGGKARYTVFTDEHRRRVLDLVALEADLSEALVGGQFELHHQPIHDIRTGADVGHEALLRWRHPVRGLLQPAAFLPAAEAGGLMVDLGEWVLREALREAARRSRTADGARTLVSVNVSAQQLVRSDFVATVTDALAESGVPSSCLVVEITESQMLPSRTSILDQLTELRTLGVQVAVDDFGTGWSSLSHLADMPVDLVKIDRSFLVDLDDSRREAVLRSAIELATAVGATCLVEGVETAEQYELVRGTGAAYAQGFLLGRPAPAPVTP
jgi:diguanylate cyclase (GGDEF)-like protein